MRFNTRHFLVYNFLDYSEQRIKAQWRTGTQDRAHHVPGRTSAPRGANGAGGATGGGGSVVELAEQVERAFNVIEKFRRERLHDKMSCSRINFQVTGKRGGTGESVAQIWLHFASAGFSEADVAMVYKLTGCYQKAVAFSLGDIIVTTAQIRYAINLFCYKNAARVELATNPAGDEIKIDVSMTREQQRALHDKLITRFFGKEQELVRDLIYSTRELIDRLKTIKNVIKYYNYLLNPAFEISPLAKVHMTVTENAYWFGLRGTGEAQDIAKFLVRSHQKTTKRTVSVKDKPGVKRGTEANVSKNQKLKAVNGN